MPYIHGSNVLKPTGTKYRGGHQDYRQEDDGIKQLRLLNPFEKRVRDQQTGASRGADLEVAFFYRLGG